MRKIKFRAWSKREKYMYKWKQIHNGNLDDMIADKDIIIRQYTGLKDKNGKEIYEGDILEHLKSKHTYKIEWDEESASYYMQGINPAWTGFYFSNHHTEIYDDDFKIIGNIYENPELLKKK
ncbi:MAG: hypothetical protein E3J87_11055 [Candidatus Cloacimonadota bacterium]|nr:MAG: hypothetical protein E3J87_11055 [Candidatus Cloacimonadota bacterium]